MFLQLTLEIGAADSEELESACFAAGAHSVTLSDATDTPVLEPAPGTTPLWPRIRLSALFAGDREPAQIVTAIAAALGGSLPSHHFERIGARIWEREWLKDFHPMRFGSRLWVCPHGVTAPVSDGIVVRLDPGLAFGTGTHATTALCLEWLDAAAVGGLDVLDYGCGSGILAIAAARLGARSVTAVDLDPQALLATRDNAARNGVADRIATRTPGESLAAADVLIANILCEPLIALAPRLQGLVRARGRIVLAGILTSQAGAVTLAYRPWFDIRPFGSREGWVCLLGAK